jgi:nitroimidazol reductase NimA-like FMN-containing flavoprotein (pyridoxamine 5'-phosphate oxidase superfamily)
MSDTPKTKLRRKPSRGSHDRETIEAILDEALVSHLGVIEEAGFPVVTPTLHARVGSHLYVHGSAASRTLHRAGASEVCLTATLIDGLVLARAAMHHSANYRSVMVFGRARQVEDVEEKRGALEALIEKLVPGRWADVREPTERELRATSVLQIPLEEASAKIRRGPPVDDEDDYELPVWAGVVGLRLAASRPEPDKRLTPRIECPGYVTELARTLGQAMDASIADNIATPPAAA